MLNSLDANAASALTLHTEYARLYTRNFVRSPVERVMPNAFNLPYMKQYGSIPGGIHTSVIIPIITPDNAYQGPFAIADQVPLIRPLPWERKVT